MRALGWLAAIAAYVFAVHWYGRWRQAQEENEVLWDQIQRYEEAWRVDLADTPEE